MKGWSISARWAAGWAVIVLAVLSRGDVLVLAVLLALVSWRPTSVVGLAAALVATGWRWGSTALEAIAGAQAVLGPAGWVGPTRASASTWLAAAAVVLAAPRLVSSADEVEGTRAQRADLDAPNPADQRSPSVVGGTGAWRTSLGAPNLVWALGFGAAVAVIVAGPALGGAIWTRVLATLVASALALAVGDLRRRGPLASVLDGVAVAAGVAALVLVSGHAPAWSGTLQTEALGSGLAVAVAVGALVVSGSGAAAVIASRRP